MIQEFKEKFNLSATCTAKDLDDWCHRMNNGDNEIDYSGSITLYEIVKLFNENYLSFRLAYADVVKTKFSDNIKLLNYNGSKIYNMDKCLALLLYNPIKEVCPLDEIMMFIVEEDSYIYSFVTDYYDTSKYYKELSIDKSILKDYLNFMDDNYLFLDSYKKMKKDFGFTSDDALKCSLINGDLCEQGLSTLELKFGLFGFGEDDYAEIVFSLGDNIDILYDKCKLVLDSKKVNASNEVYYDLVNSCYVNRTKLPSMYMEDNINKKVKSLNK